MVKNEKLASLKKILTAGTNSFTFGFSGSTEITFSISLTPSQLSRNSLKIYKPCRVFLQVSSFSCCSENAFTSSLLITTNIGVVIAPNRVHFAKFTEAEIVRSSLNIITRVTYIKVRHSVSGCSDCIDSTSVFVPGKTLPSVKQMVEQ